MAKTLQPSVGFISIEVRSVRSSRPFYETLAKALELELVYEEKDYVGWGNKEFHLIISEEDQPRVKRQRPTGKEKLGVADCIGIWLPDKKSVVTVADRMRKGGIEPLYPPEEIKDWGQYYTVSFCDPDNFVIEIFHMPEE
jgi:predicted lactoylglutathione lyase